MVCQTSNGRERRRRRRRGKVRGEFQRGSQENPDPSPMSRPFTNLKLARRVQSQGPDSFFRKATNLWMQWTFSAGCSVASPTVVALVATFSRTSFWVGERDSSNNKPHQAVAPRDPPKATQRAFQPATLRIDTMATPWKIFWRKLRDTTDADAPRQRRNLSRNRSVSTAITHGVSHRPIRTP